MRYDGVAWTPAEALSSGGNPATYPDITVDREGRVHAVWHQDHGEGNTEIHHRFWDRSSWLPEERLTDAEYESSFPAIAASTDGEVHAVWQDYPWGLEFSRRIMHARWRDGSWGEQERLPFVGNYDDQFGATIAADQAGNIHVSYCMDESHPNIYYDRWDGRIWATQLIINSFHSDQPAIGTDPFGSVHVVWSTPLGQNREIYYREHVALEAPTSGIDAIAPLRATQIVCAPNPFHQGVTLSMEMTTTETVLLEVLDVSGRHVRTLLDGSIVSGSRAFRWDGTDSRGHAVASGVYFYRLAHDGEVQTGPLVRTR
jgi:hypothetical protein